MSTLSGAMRKFEFKPRHAETLREVADRHNISVATRDVVKAARTEKRRVVRVNDTDMVLLKMALPTDVKPIGGWPSFGD
ncbi:hypothetical protein BZM26_10160 [Paraburkholderia strydomiana]|nr:hypothetical protein BZM26_10160 [Paraburkholderia strydomiana]